MADQGATVMRRVSGSMCRENESLRRLAEALGGTVESVFGMTAETHDLTALNELLGLWASLTSDASRAEALNAVRAIAKAQSVRSSV